MFGMVRFLVRDVVPHCISRGGTDGERSVAFLPAKVSVEILLDPVGRVLLEISHDISNAMHWTETRQDVHVIVHTANNLRNPVHSPDYAAQVRMKHLPFLHPVGVRLFSNCFLWASLRSDHPLLSGSLPGCTIFHEFQNRLRRATRLASFS